jgi:hypothetical protein
MIPKLVWQTHEASADDLETFQKNIGNTWNFLNPTWTHKYVDAEQRALDIQEYDQELYPIYLRLSKTSQADLWRYVKLYQEGGVYADMDSVCVKPLDDLVDAVYNGEDMICTPIGLGTDDGDGLVNNSNFAAIKNSKILKDVIDSIKAQHRILNAENPGNELFANQSICWSEFCDTVIKNQDLVSFTFDCESHSSELKIKFSDYEVHYSGIICQYLDLAKLQKWDVYTDI